MSPRRLLHHRPFLPQPLAASRPERPDDTRNGSRPPQHPSSPSHTPLTITPLCSTTRTKKPKNRISQPPCGHHPTLSDDSLTVLYCFKLPPTLGLSKACPRTPLLPFPSLPLLLLSARFLPSFSLITPRFPASPSLARISLPPSPRLYATHQLLYPKSPRRPAGRMFMELSHPTQN